MAFQYNLPLNIHYMAYLRWNTIHCSAWFVGNVRKGVAIIFAFQCDGIVCATGVVTMDAQAVIRGQTWRAHIIGICTIVTEVSHKYDQYY